MSFRYPRVERIGVSVAALLTLILAFVLALAASAAKASEPVPAGERSTVRLFGSNEKLNRDISPFPKWTSALARYDSERQLEDQPCTGACPLQRWNAFVAGLAGQDRLRQLEAVNAYVNRVPYQTDQARYGTVDYWATPREFFGRTGDCEDYAIAKYISLRKLGWGAHELRLVVLKDEVKNELHAVLVAYHGGTAYVLDNLLASVTDHAAIRNYRPIFSINEIAWHFHRDWDPSSVQPVAAAPRPLPQLAAPAVNAVPQPAVETVRAVSAPRAYVRSNHESMAAIFTNAGDNR